MKSQYIIFAFIAVVFASCVKDRVSAPGSTGPINVGSRKLIHYWGFNNSDTSVMLHPDTTIGGAGITYVAAYFDAISPGTLLNARMGEDTASALRMRNPYTSMTIKMPTTGYKQPILTLAVEASGSGPSSNGVSYTTDGVNYTSANITSTFSITSTGWTELSIDFSNVPAVDDNANFAVKFTTLNNNTGATGNDRYDNISLDAFAK